MGLPWMLGAPGGHARAHVCTLGGSRRQAVHARAMRGSLAGAAICCNGRCQEGVFSLSGSRVEEATELCDCRICHVGEGLAA